MDTRAFLVYIVIFFGVLTTRVLYELKIPPDECGDNCLVTTTNSISSNAEISSLNEKELSLAPTIPIQAIESESWGQRFWFLWIICCVALFSLVVIFWIRYLKKHGCRANDPVPRNRNSPPFLFSNSFDFISFQSRRKKLDSEECSSAKQVVTSKGLLAEQARPTESTERLYVSLTGSSEGSSAEQAKPPLPMKPVSVRSELFTQGVTANQVRAALPHGRLSGPASHYERLSTKRYSPSGGCSTPFKPLSTKSEIFSERLSSKKASTGELSSTDRAKPPLPPKPVLLPKSFFTSPSKQLLASTDISSEESSAKQTSPNKLFAGTAAPIMGLSAKQLSPTKRSTVTDAPTEEMSAKPASPSKGLLYEGLSLKQAGPCKRLFAGIDVPTKPFPARQIVSSEQLSSKQTSPNKIYAGTAAPIMGLSAKQLSPNKRITATYAPTEEMSPKQASPSKGLLSEGLSLKQASPCKRLFAGIDVPTKPFSARQIVSSVQLSSKQASPSKLFAGTAVPTEGLFEKQASPSKRSPNDGLFAKQASPDKRLFAGSNIPSKQLSKQASPGKPFAGTVVPTEGLFEKQASPSKRSPNDGLFAKQASPDKRLFAGSNIPSKQLSKQASPGKPFAGTVVPTEGLFEKQASPSKRSPNDGLFAKQASPDKRLFAGSNIPSKQLSKQASPGKPFAGTVVPTEGLFEKQASPSKRSPNDGLFAKQASPDKRLFAGSNIPSKQLSKQASPGKPFAGTVVPTEGLFEKQASPSKRSPNDGLFAKQASPDKRLFAGSNIPRKQLPKQASPCKLFAGTAVPNDGLFAKHASPDKRLFAGSNVPSKQLSKQASPGKQLFSGTVVATEGLSAKQTSPGKRFARTDITTEVLTSKQASSSEQLSSRPAVYTEQVFAKLTDPTVLSSIPQTEPNERFWNFVESHRHLSTNLRISLKFYFKE